MIPRHGLAVCTAAACVVAAAPATAQLLQDRPTVVVPVEPPITTAISIFARDQAIAVADRMLPEFSATGFSLGEFDVFPGLAVGGLYTSNLLANNDDKRSDVALVLRPELTIRTSAGPYQLTAYARGDVRRYASNTSENTEEALGGIRYAVAIGPLSSLSGGVSYGTYINPRFAADSPIDAAKPLEYTALNAFTAATIEGASARLIVRGDISRLRFGTTPRVGGGNLLTQDRDRSRYELLARLERALNPALSIYGAASVNRIDYSLITLGGLNRDSKGYGVYVGSSFELTRLLRGDARVGYIRQNFDLAGLRPISGLGALGTLTFFPNRLWTFTARAESSVQDSGVPGSGGFLHRGGSLRADHELRRYIIATLEGGYFRDTYRGLARRDSLPFGDVSFTYLSRNHWNARLGYRYIARDCACTSGVTDFDDHRISATLTFQK